MFKFCFSDRKGQIFQLDKVCFADVASSYVEKSQRSIDEKADAAPLDLLQIIKLNNAKKL